MPSVVFDASSLVGALLKAGSVPEHALLLARSHAGLCLSPEVEREIREVLARPKFQKHVPAGRMEAILGLIVNGAMQIEPKEKVTDCRDAKDNKYLELALAAGASAIVSSDQDLLSLNPWRGIPIVTPAQYVLDMKGVFR